MSAKSAPQLCVSPLNRVRGAAFNPGGIFAVLLAMAVLMAAAAWQLEQSATEALAASTQPSAPQNESTPTVEPMVTVTPAVAVADVTEARPENSRYRALSRFLARRYKVSLAVTHDLVTMAYAAGHQIGVDPLLIIAVMAVESRFNPIAESVAGAKGLMQIIPRYHSDKFRALGGVTAVFDPETNILVGSQIIKEYIARTGNLNSALQLYGGDPSDETDGYFGKVMTEKQRLLQVLQRSS